MASHLYLRVQHTSTSGLLWILTNSKTNENRHCRTLFTCSLIQDWLQCVAFQVPINSSINFFFKVHEMLVNPAQYSKCRMYISYFWPQFRYTILSQFLLQHSCCRTALDKWLSQCALFIETTCITAFCTYLVFCFFCSITIWSHIISSNFLIILL